MTAIVEDTMTGKDIVMNDAAEIVFFVVSFYDYAVFRRHDSVLGWEGLLRLDVGTQAETKPDVEGRVDLRLRLAQVQSACNMTPKGEQTRSRVGVGLSRRSTVIMIVGA